MGDRARTVINELKIEKKMLIESNKNLSAHLERPVKYASLEVGTEISNLKAELYKLKATKHQDKKGLDMKNRKLIIAYTLALISWLLLHVVFI